MKTYPPVDLPVCIFPAQPECVTKDYLLFDVVFNMIIYINDKEKNSSLCVFVPGDATAFPDWEIWALAC